MTPQDKTKAIKDRKVGFAEQQEFTGVETRINQELMKYDQVEHSMVCRWGVNRLVELAPKDMQDLWYGQIEKLNDAIEARDLNILTQVVDGCIRGWKALESSAISKGFIAYPPYQWECEVDGIVYKVARTPQDASEINKRNKSTDVLALQELCRVYAARHQAITTGPVVENEVSNQKITFPQGGGDSIPF